MCVRSRLIIVSRDFVNKGGNRASIVPGARARGLCDLLNPRYLCACALVNALARSYGRTVGLQRG